MEFEVVQGDIADERADALVNAAGTSLRMGSGVAGALRRRGGEALNEEATAKGPVDLGDVAVTDAYDLDADVVIHAAAMPHYGDGRATASSVRRAAHNALVAADEHGCRSVVMPILGTGAAGLPIETGAREVCAAVDAFEPETLEEVRIIAYGPDDYAALGRVADEVGGG